VLCQLSYCPLPTAVPRTDQPITGTVRQVTTGENRIPRRCTPGDEGLGLVRGGPARSIVPPGQTEGIPYWHPSPGRSGGSGAGPGVGAYLVSLWRV
jgi:hypothetical protein